MNTDLKGKSIWFEFLLRETGRDRETQRALERKRGSLWLPTKSNKRLKTEKDDTTDDEQDKDTKSGDEHDQKTEDNNDDNIDEEEELEPVYVQARRLFNEHEVMKSPTIKWTECQPEALTKFWWMIWVSIQSVLRLPLKNFKKRSRLPPNHSPEWIPSFKSKRLLLPRK